MNDEVLQHVLGRLECEVPLGSEASDRVLERALGQFDADVEGDGEAFVFDLDRHRRPDPKRSLLAVAAACVALVGLGALLLATARGDDETPTADTVITPPPNLPPPTADGSNNLGFEPTSTYDYRAIGSDSVDELASLSMRAGNINPSDGEMTIRRITRRKGSQTATRDEFTIRVRLDEAVEVPLDFLDPMLFGGSCTGGTIIIGLTAPSEQRTIASCGGNSETGVTITSRADAPQRLVLLADPIEATPFEYNITPVGGDTRNITLWLTTRGLVQISLDVGGELVDLVAHPATAIQIEQP